MSSVEVTTSAKYDFDIATSNRKGAYFTSTAQLTLKKPGCYNRCVAPRGDIAQLGERGVRNAEVGGSSPPISTICGYGRPVPCQTGAAQPTGCAVDLAPLARRRERGYSVCAFQIQACRSGGTADALRSGRSTRKGVWVQIPPSAPHLYYRALVAQLDRAQPCGG